jgi:hypothetical protein
MGQTGGRILHHDVVKRAVVHVLLHDCGSGGDKLGRLVADPLFTQGLVARTTSPDADIEVHPVLGSLAFGYLQEADRREQALWIDQCGAVLEVVAGLVCVAKCKLPELREPTGIRRVAADRPERSHLATLWSAATPVRDRQSALGCATESDVRTVGLRCLVVEEVGS